MPNQTQERTQTASSGPSLKERFSREVPNDIKNLSVSELVQHLDTEPVRQFLLSKYSTESKRIADALRTKKVSARTNADLEGYRSYVVNFRILRRHILEIANAGVCTQETQEILSKVIDRVELHHTRVAKDIEGKYPDLFSTTSASPEPKNTVPDKSPDSQAQIDTKRDALLSGKNTPADSAPANVEIVLGAPETLGDAYATLKALKDKIVAAQSKGNPTALIANAQYQEFAVLLAATEKVLDDSKGHGMYGERIDPELAATLLKTFKKLTELGDDIVSFLEGKPVAASSAAPEPSPADAMAIPVIPAASTPVAPEPLKNHAPNVTPSADMQTVLTAKQMFREQFRGTKDLDKKIEGQPGKFYTKEKAKLGEALGAYYTRGLFARAGARARSLLGMKAAGLTPELQAQKSAALEAAKAYSASIEERYGQRLGRELQAGRIDLKTFNIRMAQFRSMTANRFVFQTMDMVHGAERKALTDVGEGALGKFSRWYGALSKPAKVAIGTAVVAGTGLLAGAAAVAIGARAGFKAVMIATDLGTIIGKKTNDFVVSGAQENVRDTVMDIGRNYAARNIETEQAEYMDSLRVLDRRKTIGVAASMAVGAGVSGGGTIAAEHLADTFAAPDLQSHLDAIPKPVLEVHHDAPAAIPKPIEVPAAPEMPHIALAPNAGHLYHPVAANETLWGHSESFFDKELRAHFIAGHDRDLVLENLRERLLAHPELAREIGISSGNPDQIEYSHVVGITGEAVKGDTIDDTLLGKVVNEEIAKLAAKVGTPMEQATGTHLHAGMPASEGSVLDTPSSVPAPAPQPPVPGDVLPVKPDTLDMTHAQKIPLPESNTPYVPVDVPQPTIPTPLSSASGVEIAAGTAALGAGVLSARENGRVVGRAPKPAEVQQRKQDIIRLIEKPKPASRIGRFFGSFSQTDAAPQAPYEVLKNMSVTSVAENLATKPNETESVKAAREGRKAAFVRENRIDAKTFEHWLDNFELWKRIVAGSDTKISDSMTFDTLLEKISEYQLERGETLQG